jgi:single-stranded-DNA-specific exonuclease
MKTWIEPSQEPPPLALQQMVGGHPLIAQVLMRRGLLEPEPARAFLDPGAFTPHSPLELPGMKPAVGRLEQAIHQEETICVWGDFDVDGQTATTLLVSALRRLGGRVIYHIPLRLVESHGVNPEALQQVLQAEDISGSGVLLTCDTGISAHPALQYARQRGLDVLVTDHHDLPPELPPALALVNPKFLPPGHPLGSLPGVGVAYKLVEALYDRAGMQQECAGFLDLVALGIVADLAVLSGETRYLLQRGLQVLRSTPRLGLQIMMELADLNPAGLSEEHIGYILAPRLNSLGRLADANPVVEFLTTSDETRARLLALEMEALNARRKLLTDQVFRAALAQVEQDPALREAAALVLAHPAWPGGVIGIVASQLVERFGKPVILFSAPPGELARGSARSVEGVNITAAIAAQADLLAAFGGHPMAAGLAIATQRIPEFRRRLSRTILDTSGESVRQATLQIDGYLPLSDLSLDLVADLERLAPFGPGNPRLVLTTRNLTLSGYASIGRGEEHLLLTVEDEDERAQRVVWWQGAGNPLPEGRFDLAYSVRASTYRGQRDVQVEWVDTRPADQASAEVTSPQLEVVDYRREAYPALVLQQLQAVEVLQVWCEAPTPGQPSGRTRQELQPGESLAIWTAPPGRIELRQVLQRVSPSKVYLFAVDPGMDRLDGFIKRLAGLVKYTITARQSCVDVQALAAATAQRPSVIVAGIHWLQAYGYLRVVGEVGSELQLEKGDGLQTKELPQAQAILQGLLQESAAYRSYISRADPRLLLELGSDHEP